MLRILLVDDYEQFRQFIRLMFRGTEFSIVEEAADGLEAIHKAEELQPDLVILDIGLPRLNGIEAARQIRTVAPKSRILFVSQERDEDVIQEALNLGALGYVHKSLARRDLLPAAEAVIAGREFVSLGSSDAGVRTNAALR
jgi:DNA-binding NarL/FixJ family response regulator